MKQLPNILVFMTDHQRGDTILSNSPVKTPNVDRLRKQAVTFENAYCPAPHCCPSRASFFTGLYPSEHGIWNNVAVSNALSYELFDNVRLFSQDLKDAGYQLYFSGKWHVSATHGPQDYGFTILRHPKTYAPHPHLPDTNEWNLFYTEGHKTDIGNEERTEARIIRPGYTSYTQYGINEDPYKDQDTVAAAVEQLKKMDSDKPFFLYTGVLGPHDPYCVPQRFLDMYNPDEIELPKNFHDTMEDKPALYRRTQDRYAQLSEAEHKESIRRFYAFCSYEDYLFGQLLDTLEEQNLMENTLVLYVSDHGDYIGSHGLWAKGLPCFKEAYHVCSMAGGGVVKNPGRVEHAFISLADWAPTFLEMAGITPKQHMAGKSLVPFLENQNPQEWRDTLFTQTNGNEVYGIQRAVFNKRWKYVFNSFDYDELYDLEADPQELHNLLHGIKDVDIPNCPYADIVRTMCEQMWQFAYANKDNCVNPYIMTAFAPYGPGIIFQK